MNQPFIYTYLLFFGFPSHFPCNFFIVSVVLMICCCCLVASLILLWPYRRYAAHQAPLSMGFPRQKFWSRLPFPSPRVLSHPGIEPWSPASAGGFFTAGPPGKHIIIIERLLYAKGIIYNSPFILSITQWDGLCYYPQFTDGDTEAQTREWFVQALLGTVLGFELTPSHLQPAGSSALGELQWCYLSHLVSF